MDEIVWREGEGEGEEEEEGGREIEEGLDEEKQGIQIPKHSEKVRGEGALKGRISLVGVGRGVFPS
jgi:hypothetical protein